MPDLIRLLLVQEQRFYSQCLAMALNASGRFAAIDHAVCVADALDQLQRQPFQLMAADWQLPAQGAVELTRAVSRDFASVKVLVLGIAEATDTVRECFEAGAVGYVTNGETVEQLLARIEQALRGETVCAPAIARALCSRLAELARAHQLNGHGNGATILTFREMQVLRLIADGLSNKQIASRLDLSLHTVKNHVHNLLEKLSAQGRCDAVRCAYERQWLKR